MKRIVVELILLIKKTGTKRAKFLKKHNIFGSMGINCSWRPFVLPSEPKSVFLGNNVNVAAGVRFITHDMSFSFINRYYGIYSNSNKLYVGTIRVGNNVMIGADSIILYNHKIGNNVIIAAGSVVVNDIPDNEIWGGNPAKRIGYFDKFIEKRWKIMTEEENIKC